MKVLLVLFFVLCGYVLSAQTRDTIPTVLRDSVPVVHDTLLRISKLPPYITLASDSILSYQPEINKTGKYFWFLRNAPVGLQINKDNGTLSFKAAKSFFLSGKLKYDYEYKVQLGVNNPTDPSERIDTGFTLVFYNTEIIPSRVKLSVSQVLNVDEGDTVSFRVQCEAGSFPIENIVFYATQSLKSFTPVKHCDDDFTWSPSFDFVKETDSGKVKIIYLSFVGSNKFQNRDTAQVKIIVRDALNFPLAVQTYHAQVKTINTYLMQLKYSFLQLDRSIKRVKNTRTTFDITSSATALTGTILGSAADAGSQKVGKILPSVGISLVPVKEAVSPQKVYDQNQAAQIRTSIKRLEYMLADNVLVTEKDPDIVKKTNKLKDELKQIQVQLIDLPVSMDSNMTEEELNEYFNSPKVTKKYRLKRK